jgi:hypothetical protein
MVRRLLGRIEISTADPEGLTLACTLIKRATTRRCRRAAAAAQARDS